MSHDQVLEQRQFHRFFSLVEFVDVDETKFADNRKEIVENTVSTLAAKSQHDQAGNHGGHEIRKFTDERTDTESGFTSPPG